MSLRLVRSSLLLSLLLLPLACPLAVAPSYGAPCTSDEDCGDGYECGPDDTCTTATPDEDGGATDDAGAHEPVDGGPDAGTQHDAGIEPVDGGAPPEDAGTPPEDGGAPPVDAGTTEDAGAADAGASEDAGTPECEAHLDCSDGVFCNGAELCVQGECVTGMPPCSDAQPFCDEAGGLCLECTADAHCSDGDFCSGQETCNAGQCQTASDPCAGSADPFCNEGLDRCDQCIGDEHCAGDGQFCNGAEFCGDDKQCASSGNPCAASATRPHCNEGLDRCDQCNASAPCAGDGQFCNGAETCGGDGTCYSPGNPCGGVTPYCIESRDKCGECVSDDHCPGFSEPYCGTNNTCVECRTSDDCGFQQICLAGYCEY